MSKSIVQSFKVATTLAAYRGVGAISGTANTVGYPESNQKLPFGITLDDVKDITEGIPVACAGSIAKLYFNDTVGTGQLVGLDSSGRGVPFTIGALTSTSFTLMAAYIGVLVGPAVAATAVVENVLVMPGYARGTA